MLYIEDSMVNMDEEFKHTRGQKILAAGIVIFLLIFAALGQNYPGLTLTVKILCSRAIENIAASLLSSLFCLILQPNLLLSAENPASLRLRLK